MKMRSFDFYEFVGIILPGSMLLLAFGYLLNTDTLDLLLRPNGVGALGVHLLIAYIIGHLLQALGNLIQYLYWKAWRGMPTDWPITKKGINKFPTSINSVNVLCGTNASTDTDIQSWQSLIARARAEVYSSGRSARLQYFNGIYGMFRGIVAAGLVLLCASWMTPWNQFLVYSVIVIIMAMSLYRMHRFGIHYAVELFSNIHIMASEKTN